MLGAGGLVAIVAASILVGLILVVNLREDGQRVNVRDVPYATAVATAALNAKGAANDERGFLLTGDSDFISEAHARIHSARSAFAAAKSAATDTARRQVVTEASAGFERWVQALNEEITTFKSGDRRSPIAVPWASREKLARPMNARWTRRRLLVRARWTPTAAPSKRRQHDQ